MHRLFTASWVLQPPWLGPPVPRPVLVPRALSAPTPLPHSLLWRPYRQFSKPHPHGPLCMTKLSPSFAFYLQCLLLTAAIAVVA